MTRCPPPGDGSLPTVADRGLLPDRTTPRAPAAHSPARTRLADDPQQLPMPRPVTPHPGLRGRSPPASVLSLMATPCVAPSRARRAGNTAATHRDEPTAHRRLAATAQPPAAGEAETGSSG